MGKRMEPHMAHSKGDQAIEKKKKIIKLHNFTFSLPLMYLLHWRLRQHVHAIAGGSLFIFLLLLLIFHTGGG